MEFESRFAGLPNVAQRTCTKVSMQVWRPKQIKECSSEMQFLSHTPWLGKFYNLVSSGQNYLKIKDWMYFKQYPEAVHV